MNTSQSLTDFYKQVSFKDPNVNLQAQQANEWGHFNVYRRSDFSSSCTHYKPYNRRDFFKISLVIGTGTLYYADKGIDISQNALLFSNPNIPYAWEARSEVQEGYFCLFTEGFVNTDYQSENLYYSPLFRVGGNPVFFVDEAQTERISGLFEEMLKEIASDYRYKFDLIRNYMNLILHEALKMQPADSFFQHHDAASRITSLFLELLERQFPVSFEHSLQLKSANDYAFRLSVHTNHLNRAIKKVTGKTTTGHITARLLQEAKALLQHTDWNIADIAYCLGFESPAYFNNFFKKQMSITPKRFRG
ncbi:AraC family transcriptional regulator [Rapidithrix thailandica]|uniref:AraC family transcriptional regulator n=1 Tax=Rapidithrix thailandica TaxID=413964 RepID=A0AAW9SBM4_9BACT